MTAPARRWLLLVYAVAVLGTALVGVSPTGDCGEYILMTRALATRGSPDLRSNDAYWLARREPRLSGVAGKLHHTIVDHGIGAVGTRRAPDGSYYSIHFWFYSLLAAPVFAVLEALRGPPLVALAAVNAAAALAAGCYAARCFRGTWLASAAPLLFLLTGSTFYLRRTGPEVLSAAGVLIAWLAAGRRELGIGFLATGIAATQNPSIAALFPFVTFETWRLGRTRPEPSVWRLPRRSYELALAGLLLGVLPYVFFQVEYGVPSLIGKYATDFGLIGFERLWSLFFDLNQGVLPCLPGLFAGLAVVLAARAPWSRATLARVASTIALVLVMAIPTLAAPNWNSGSSVITRYGYWLAMPLLALLLELLSTLDWRAAAPALAAFAALTLGSLGVNGFRGGSSGYLRHGWLASLVLEHAPFAYNPIVEVFVERTLGRESSASEERPVVWPKTGVPHKVLIHERALGTPAPECPGTPRLSSHVTHLSGGWQYQDGPFWCAAGPSTPAGSASARP